MGEEKRSGGMTVKKLGTKKSMPEIKSEMDHTLATNSSEGKKAATTVPGETAPIAATPHDPALATNTKLRTRSQNYAAAVFEKVKAVKDDPNAGQPFYDKYGGMAHKLPVLIRTAGLAQALAFVEVKAKVGEGVNEKKKKVEAKALETLLSDISRVVIGAHADAEKLCNASRDNNTDLFGYMHLTRKTMDALVWFKRFAVSILNVKQGEDDVTKDADLDDVENSAPSPLSDTGQGAKQ